MPLHPQVQQALESVIGSIYNLQTSAGGGYKRYYSAIFRDLPDRYEYPDYYVVIKEPRCLHGVLENMRRGAYSSAQAVAFDLFLIWSNAREYNEQGSLVYADADKLEDYMERLWRERCPPLPPFESLPRPGAAAPPPVAPSPAEPERKVKRIKLTGSLGSSAASPGLAAHTPTTPSAPGPTKPTLTIKLGGNRQTVGAAGGIGASGAGLPPLPTLPTLPTLPAHGSDRQQVTGGYGSSQAEASTARAVKAESAGPDGDDAPSTTPAVPTVPDTESGWMGGDIGGEPTQVYRDILAKIRTYTDASGRPLATPLIDVPDREARPDYYELVSDPVSLNTIEAKVNAGAYSTPEAFDRALHHLFAVAKLFIRPESPGTIYTDLMVLQRLYQELTKRVSPLLRTAEISDAAALASVGGGPGNVQHARGDDGAVGLDLKSRATTRPTTKDKIFLDSINFKGDVLKTGDWVLLLNPDNPGKPIIAQIWKTYRRQDSPQRCLSVCWYYRPEETVHPASRTFYENEVFKTGVFMDHNVEDFLDRCFVMFFTRYTRGRPKPPAWTPSIPLFVCEHRYKDDIKAFKKIKSWASCIPEEIRVHEYDFEPFEDGHVEQLARVKSPFVRGMAGPGRLSGAAASAPAYHFSQDGKPQTAEEAKATSPEARAQPASSFASTVAQPTADFDSPAPVPQPTFLALVAQTPAIPSLSSLPPSLSDFAVEPVGASSPASTPAEQAASLEDFAPLPASMKSKFRNDALGDVLWFSAPAAAVAPITRPAHSLEYLYWRAQQRQQLA
ncbi:hypothetical protein JCM10296v2_001480 [Rhodotorula toruloides]